MPSFEATAPVHALFILSFSSSLATSSSMSLTFSSPLNTRAPLTQQRKSGLSRLLVAPDEPVWLRSKLKASSQAHSAISCRGLSTNWYALMVVYIPVLPCLLLPIMALVTVRARFLAAATCGSAALHRISRSPRSEFPCRTPAMTSCTGSLWERSLPSNSHNLSAVAAAFSSALGMSLRLKSGDRQSRRYLQDVSAWAVEEAYLCPIILVLCCSKAASRMCRWGRRARSLCFASASSRSTSAILDRTVSRSLSTSSIFKKILLTMMDDA
mmetsp:Transcript_22859/g.50104  ORF Transcript_22859/g.50104 Transcript_22859/m.50104 type:complete len:269 (-) Transcript_22859:38-844(-)